MHTNSTKGFYMPILTAALLNVLIGFFWYSPFLFGKQWLHSLGKRQTILDKKSAIKAYATSFTMALILAFVLSQFITANHMGSLLQGAKIGFWVWFGFIMTTSLPDYLFGNKRLQLYVLNNAYHLITLVLMGALLGAWH